jgi:hypothetical protein
MNLLHTRCAPQYLMAAALSTLLFATSSAMAAPGAHGPNGEHLDGATTSRNGTALPRLEAKSEAFELVGTLHRGEFSVLVDRYESNEPILNAALEVESGGIKAKATFHADQGDYAVDDPKLLALLHSPGEHGLVFTLVAGKESDLLEGTLANAAGGAGTAKAAGDDHGHAHGGDEHGHDHELERAAWIGAGVAALGLIGGIAWWRQRRRDAGKLQGGL